MDKEYAEYLLSKTKEDYNLIADDFSNTREFIPEAIKKLGGYAKDGNKILDLGCGNGRLIEAFKNKKIEYIGLDNSEKLVNIAKEKYPQAKFMIAPALNLPFPDNYFDKVYGLAVLHHIPSIQFREQFIKEIRRVLVSGGILILTVWDFWYLWCKPLAWVRNKRLKKYFKLIFKNTFLRFFGKSKLDFKDIFIPWQNKAMRYVHCFTKAELSVLLKKNGFKIKEIGTSKNEKTKLSNIYIVAEK